MCRLYPASIRKVFPHSSHFHAGSSFFSSNLNDDEEENEDDLTNDSTVQDAKENDMSWYSSQAMFQAKYASPKKATQQLIEDHVNSMLKENLKQEVVKKPVSDLLCSKPIAGVPWSTLYYKLRDPSWSRRGFFAKLSTEEGKTLME
mgnify:CR=1 FL=1